MKKPALIIISLSFVVGILGGVAWGRKISRLSLQALGLFGAQNQIANGQHALRILTYKNLFTVDMKAQLASELASYQNSTVEMTEVATPEELWDKLEKAGPDQAPDVVTLFSYQIPLASQLGWLQPIDRKQIPLIKTIAADFTDLPGDPSLKQVLPVLWGVNGMALDTAASVASRMKGVSSSWPDGAGDIKSWADVLASGVFKNKVGFPNSTITGWRLGAIEKQFAKSLEKDDGESETDLRGRGKKSKSTATSSTLAKALQPWFSYAQFSDVYDSAVPLLKGEDAPILILASSGEMAFAPLNEKQWKFTLPAEKGTFWYLSFALGREARDDRQAYIFLNAILQKQMSERFVQLTHQASTNNELERETLDARLKPSYLRQIPLNGFILWQDFSRAREVRGIMQQALKRP